MLDAPFQPETHIQKGYSLKPIKQGCFRPVSLPQLFADTGRGCRAPSARARDARVCQRMPGRSQRPHWMKAINFPVAANGFGPLFFHFCLRIPIPVKLKQPEKDADYFFPWKSTGHLSLLFASRKVPGPKKKMEPFAVPTYVARVGVNSRILPLKPLTA